MKKAYVKPVMESEAFVANEYVAACWTVACDKCDAIQEGYDALYAQVKQGNTLTGDIFAGDLGGVRGCQEYKVPNQKPSWTNFWARLLWEIFVEWLGFDAGSQTTGYYHVVDTTQNWTVTKNHPYSSV